MKRFPSRFFLLLLLPPLALLLSVSTAGNHTQLSAHLHVRKLQNGSLLEYELDVLYKMNGEVICHFLPPNDYYLIAGTDGDLKLFNPETKELRMARDKDIMAPGSFFYYVLQGKTDDMDLPENHFSQTSGVGMQDLSITYWNKQEDPKDKGATTRVELVHQENQLIYMACYLADGRLLKKNYYRYYIGMGDLNIPTSISEISYFSAQDSLIEDTRYSEFAFDENVNRSLLQFTLPEDVIVK
jgi:hypothetical protein